MSDPSQMLPSPQQILRGAQNMVHPQGDEQSKSQNNNNSSRISGLLNSHNREPYSNKFFPEEKKNSTQNTESPSVQQSEEANQNNVPNENNQNNNNIQNNNNNNPNNNNHHQPSQSSHNQINQTSEKQTVQEANNNMESAPLLPPTSSLLPSVEQLSNQYNNNNNGNSSNQQAGPFSQQRMEDQQNFMQPVENEAVDSRKHAMDFLHKVRMTYLEYPEVYNNFLEIMKSVQQENIDTLSVIARVKDLFKDNEHLLQDFNAFLPVGYKIDKEDDQKAQSDLDHARNYVRKIKTRFSNRPATYKAFLEILHSYYQGLRPIAEVLEEVGELFASHRDLLEEFRLFLPKSADMMGASAGPPQERRKKRVEKTQKKRRNESPEPIYYETRGRHHSDRRQIDYEREERLLRQAHEKKKKLESLEEQRKRNFTRMEYRRRILQELQFFPVLKQRLGKKVYSEVLHLIRLFSEDLITKSALENLVKDRLINAPDLYLYFLQFVSLEGTSPVELFAQIDENEPVDIDDFFEEIDVLSSLNECTIRLLKSVIHEIHTFRTFTHMAEIDALHLKNIQRIYGSATPDIISFLRRDPLVVAPVIIKRLKQKQIEWSEVGKEEDYSLSEPEQ